MRVAQRLSLQGRCGFVSTLIIQTFSDYHSRLATLKHNGLLVIIACSDNAELDQFDGIFVKSSGTITDNYYNISTWYCWEY
jgi:hypothetical protein